MTADLVARLRALARHDHSDVSVADEAADELEAASALRSSGEASAWRPIAEAPRDGTAVILGAEGHEPVLARWGWGAPWLDGWWCDGHRSDAEGPGFEPTHFQPLPTPPTPKAQGHE